MPMTWVIPFKRNSTGEECQTPPCSSLPWCSSLSRSTRTQATKLTHPWRRQNCGRVITKPGDTGEFQRTLFPSCLQPAEVSASLLQLHHLLRARPCQSSSALHILLLIRVFSHRTLWRAHYQRLGANLAKDFPGEQQCSPAEDTTAAAAQVAGMSREKVKPFCFGFSPVSTGH